MHGSGGMGPNIEMWAREYNAMGIATFALDGFTGRGLTQVSSNQALLGRLNFILDIYRGLDVLAKHPRVDRERIVLQGFSRGGQAALYASLKRFHQLWNKSGHRVRRLRPVLSRLRHDLRSATPTSSTGRSASMPARPTTTIQSRCARPMRSG